MERALLLARPRSSDARPGVREGEMRIFDPVIQGLGSALGMYQARHRVLTENVANAETPGYRARDLDFSTALDRAFEQGGSTGSAADEPEPAVDPHAAVKIDGNSVELETEMSRLSENALKIVALSQILVRKYSGLITAIGGGQS
jgi:flagellar basal-body rod protein FlgB